MQLLTSQKKIVGPVHLHSKTDKWDYLRSPIMKFFFVSCFDIGEVPRSPGKWNWNWLYFLPFIFTFEQGAYILFKAISTCVPKVRNYADFRHTCNPHDNYMLITGYTCDTGIPRTFYGGKICSVE